MPSPDDGSLPGRSAARGGGASPDRPGPSFFRRLAHVLASPLFLAEPPRDCRVGGQAVIEGVMMRGPSGWSVNVRTPDGHVVGKTSPHKSWASGLPWRLPFFRGPAVLAESLTVGVKALNYSTETMAAAYEAGEEAPGGRKGKGKDKGKDARRDKPAPPAADPDAPAKSALSPFYLAMSLAAGLGLAVFLFVLAPHMASLWLGAKGGFDESGPAFHLVDGVLKFLVFLAYVRGIGLVPEIGRVYAYHGAEHQAIHVLEARLPLEPSLAKKFPTWHPRCGTAFIFLMLAASILLFAVLFPLAAGLSGRGAAARIALGAGLKTLCSLPLAAVAYEIARLAGRPGAGVVWRAMVWPGLLLQRLTTRVPDLGQLEVAFVSLRSVLPRGTPGGPGQFRFSR
ncbi:MAG: DUF1385 domain-containing protein [Deltaproteobacteria bacterium]|jgi:uncharacterized protein YqhQ|nr:DUF1385 domain-containing protein [Deltaproteobacteria bacterium]